MRRLPLQAHYVRAGTKMQEDYKYSKTSKNIPLKMIELYIIFHTTLEMIDNISYLFHKAKALTRAIEPHKSSLTS